ncbi:MAG: hypothetical protein AAF840_17435, partial [Bacteroidota bacterium]
MILIDGEGLHDFLIPNNFDFTQFSHIRFTLTGGDGGKARDFDTDVDIRGRGGRGALVSVGVDLGFGAEKLSPGGTLRFIVAGKGQ